MGNSVSIANGRFRSPEPSVRSDKTFESDSVYLSSVHSNLMRSRHHSDPMKLFQVMDILGEGSMGSVAKVRKRESALGGSARPAYVKAKAAKACCFQLFSFCPAFRAAQDKFINLSRHGSISASSHHQSLSVYSANSRHGGSPSEKSLAVYSSQSRNARKPSAVKPMLRESSSMMTSGSGRKEVQYALKSIHLDRCSSSEFKQELINEVEILKGLDHPNIVRALETFDYRGRLFLLLEYCSGGDLYERDPYVEEEAKRIVADLCNAVSYLHSKGIVHRDLKFENCMFENENPNAKVKIIDFGLSQKFAANEHLHDTVGTVYTMAPELLQGDYDEKADVWSLGVITFMLLSSSMPFYGKDRMQIFKKIVRGKFRFASRAWLQVSSEAKAFVSDLLVVNPRDRLSSEEALNHDWISPDKEPEGIAPDTAELMDRIQASIQRFSSYKKLKQLALMVCAYQSTTEEIDPLRKMFDQFDSMKDGEISRDEFKKALSIYGYADEQVESMFQGIDIDGTGSVHYIEFLAATLEAHGCIDEERLAEAFDRIDCDDSGYISVQDLKSFLGDDIPTAYLDKIIDEADIFTQDHRISYEEFLELWTYDDSKKMKDICLKGEMQRLTLSRENSMVSSISSQVTEALTDSEQEGNVAHGEYYYNKQKKAKSIRGEWV